MAATSESSRVRIALVDNDSGLIAVMERRFEALRWDRELLSYAPGPDQLTALRLNALIVNPTLSGVEYIERVATAMPGLAIVVISEPASVADRVRALRGGADDWVTKPCHPEELVARVQAVLRRRRVGAMPDDEPIVAGELTIRPDLFDAFVADDAAGLSRKEYDLLRHLSGADGRVLEREQIYQRVWGYTMVRGDRSVDVFVRKLRNKLERVSPDWRYVHTHFGIGYRFAPERVDGAPVQPAEPTESVQPAESTESAQPAGPAAGADGRAPVSGSGSPNSDGSAVRLELTSDRLTVS